MEYWKLQLCQRLSFLKRTIGTFSTIDRPLSAAQKGSSVYALLHHLSREKVQQFRDEILAVTLKRYYAPNDVSYHGSNVFDVIGNDTAFKNHKDIFQNIRKFK